MQKTTISARNFGIKLANDETWQFVSTSETDEWLDKLRITMGLNEYKELDGHKITFVKDISNESGIIDSLDSSGIQMFNSGPLRIYSYQSASNMICEIGDLDFPQVELFKMAQSVFPLYMKVLNQGGLPFHAALIEKNGTGIAIAAPGGTGKSTCARRIPHPWQALGDDELLIVSDKKDIYHAHPFPTWSRCNVQKPGEAWNTQKHVPLSAIFFLKKSQKDEVTPLSYSQKVSLIYKLSLPVFYRIMESIDQDEYIKIKKLIFENSCNIAKDMPAFILEASLNGKFWEVIDKALSIDLKGGCVDARMLPNTH